MPIQTLLLDIEGTTTPIDFVYKILFPYARAKLKDFLTEHLESEDVKATMARLIEEQVEDQRQGLAPPLLADAPGETKLASMVTYLHWLMDQDRKSTPLKFLQGRIWEEGYYRGELRGQLFPDVKPAFERWTREGKTICIYSSGSVLAQKLLFAHNTVADLTGFIQDYFDTTIGNKKDLESYRRIAIALDISPTNVLFVSDSVEELDAAKQVGLQTALCVRPGNPPHSPASTHPVVETFAHL